MFVHFRVIDLGVMTPCEKIIEAVIREKAGQFRMINDVIISPCLALFRFSRVIRVFKLFLPEYIVSHKI